MKRLDQKGFTLIEVMIAIVILAFIVIAIVQITGGAQEKVDRTLVEDKEMLQIETAFSRFEWDFSQIYSPLYYSHELRKQETDSDDSKQAYDALIAPYQNKENFDDLSYDGYPIPKFKFEDKTDITFFTISNRRKLKNIKQSNFAWVRYELQTDRDADDEVDTNGIKKTRAKGIWVRKFNPKNVFSNETIDWSKIKSQVLLRNVDSIKVEFWDVKNKKWVDNLRLIDNGEKLFRGIRISLKWISTDEVEQLYVRTFRPLTPFFIPEDMYKLASPDAVNNDSDGFGSDEDEEDDEDEDDNE